MNGCEISGRVRFKRGKCINYCKAYCQFIARAPEERVRILRLSHDYFDQVCNEQVIQCISPSKYNTVREKKGI